VDGADEAGTAGADFMIIEVKSVVDSKFENQYASGSFALNISTQRR